VKCRYNIEGFLHRLALSATSFLDEAHPFFGSASALLLVLLAAWAASEDVSQNKNQRVEDSRHTKL
jgi:hypothetical protein